MVLGIVLEGWVPAKEGLVSYCSVCSLSAVHASSQRPPGAHVVEQLGFLAVAARELPTIGAFRASQQASIKDDLLELS